MLAAGSFVRRIGNFSSGAASAVACALARPDRILYADTGSEDWDNERFRLECEAKLFSVPVEVVKSDKYATTWETWEGERYLGGVAGAPCARALKARPLRAARHTNDVVIIGYTADETRRADHLSEIGEELFEFPLIERGITKEGARALLAEWGIREPRVYAMGFEHANCIPCCKASSGDYWQRIRKHFPAEFERYAETEQRARERGRNRGQAYWHGEWLTLRELPVAEPKGVGKVPACDFLCQLAAEDAL